MIVLLALGEGSQLVNAVTEETTSSTAANEKVLPAQDAVDSTEKTTTSSSEVAKEETSSSSEEATTESTKETSEETEKKKEKSKATRGATDPVNIPDPELNKWIRATLNNPYGLNLGLPDSDPVTEELMEKLTELTRGTNGSGLAAISDLTGLEYAVNLVKLDFYGTVTYHEEDKFTALPSGFKNLTKLEELKFFWGELNDIDALKNHPNLKVFHAQQNNLTSLEGLTGCKELLEVNIDGSDNSTYAQNGGVKNFKGLESATKLKSLSFKKFDEQTGDTARKLSEAEHSYDGYGLQSLEGLNCSGSLETLNLKGHPGLHTLDGLENYTSLTTLKVVGAANYNGRGPQYENPGSITDGDFDPAIYTPTFYKRGLRGGSALNALSNCTSLTDVDLNGHAIEDISPLANKPSIKSLNLKRNLLETIQPLKSTNKIVILDVSNNLLSNLSGIENTDTLEELDCSMQNAGARDVQIYSGSRHLIRGLLSDVSAINPASLKKLYCYSNRLKKLDSLKNASNLTYLSAYNNELSDIKGNLAGCVSLETANLSNNKFVNFADTGLEDSKNSLTYLYLKEQGIHQMTSDVRSNTDALLESLSGLKQFTVLEHLNISSNIITDEEMQYIPVCLMTLYANNNELQDKAFETFKPSDFTRLGFISATHNHISDITPLEAFTNSMKVDFTAQDITVPKHGGVVTEKTSPNVGFEVDVLKSDKGTGLAFTKPIGTKGATFDVKAGTNVLDITDSNYDLFNTTPVVKFEYTGNTSAFSSFVFSGNIRFVATYDIATTAGLKLVPTDINGVELTEIPQGGLIYWRATVDSDNANFLMKPNFAHHLQYTEHDIFTSYSLAADTQATEYVDGVRVEINGTRVATPSGFWGQKDELDNKINKTNVAKITIVTKVRDDATPGTTANMYFNFTGKNFTQTKDTKTVLIKAKAPEVINLSVPDRFDFGKGNEATKKAKIYKPDAKAYSAKEQTDGFNVRVTDTRQGASRTDWKVVAQLSDLTNSKSTALKAGSVAPTLSLRDISLYKMDLGAGTETSIAHGSTGNPTWDQDILLTAGGSSVKVTNAQSANGEGVWDYRIPFDKVELTVPANVNEQAGYTFKGKLTWTLDNTL